MVLHRLCKMTSDFVLAIINVNPLPIGATIIAHQPQPHPNEYAKAVWTAVAFGAPVMATSVTPMSSNLVQHQDGSITNEHLDSPEDSNSSFVSSSPSSTKRRLDFDSDSGIDSWQNSPASSSSVSERYQWLEPKDFPRTYATTEFVVPNAPKYCKWGENCDFNGPRDRLLDHLITTHVLTQRRRKVFRCMWRGCRAYDRPSKKFTWLEEHCRTYHGGPTPFHCIVKDCPRRFSTKALAERHIHSCLNRLELERKKMAVQQQPITAVEVSDDQGKDEIPVTILPRQSRPDAIDPLTLYMMRQALYESYLDGATMPNGTSMMNTVDKTANSNLSKRKCLRSASRRISTENFSEENARSAENGKVFKPNEWALQLALGFLNCREFVSTFGANGGGLDVDAEKRIENESDDDDDDDEPPTLLPMMTESKPHRNDGAQQRKRVASEVPDSSVSPRKSLRCTTANANHRSHAVGCTTPNVNHRSHGVGCTIANANDPRKSLRCTTVNANHRSCCHAAGCNTGTAMHSIRRHQQRPRR